MSANLVKCYRFLFDFTLIIVNSWISKLDLGNKNLTKTEEGSIIRSRMFFRRNKIYIC
jgi:hypothetical protein